jgi:hypothetical protein
MLSDAVPTTIPSEVTSPGADVDCKGGAPTGVEEFGCDTGTLFGSLSHKFGLS